MCYLVSRMLNWEFGEHGTTLFYLENENVGICNTFDLVFMKISLQELESGRLS